MAIPRTPRISWVLADGARLEVKVVRQRVEAHGGPIRVSSHSGHGATFTVELPQLRT